MNLSRAEARALLLPVAVALVVILAYFLLSQNWTNLGNPIASIVAIIAGLAGFAAGAGRDRRRRRRPLTVAAQTPES